MVSRLVPVAVKYIGESNALSLPILHQTIFKPNIFFRLVLFSLPFPYNNRYLYSCNHHLLLKMKFTSSAAILSIAALAGTTLAAPMQDSTKLQARDFNVDNPRYTLLPETTSQYDVGTGAVTFNTGVGEVDKSTSNGGHDITSLVSFYIPWYTAGYTCEVVFDLEPTASLSGTAGAQAFMSRAPATVTTSTWPQGNQRDGHVGTLKALSGQRATWDLPASTRQFSCADAAGHLYGGELVPTGDNDHIGWTPGTDGPKIVVY